MPLFLSRPHLSTQREWKEYIRWFLNSEVWIYFLLIIISPETCFLLHCGIIKKQRHHFADKGLYSQSYGFSSNHVWMWELDHKKSWALKNWCCWTVVLEKTLESPLDSKIKLINPKGYHWLDGHEFEKTPGDGEEQGSLACCSPWGRKQMNTIEWLHNSNKTHLTVSLHKYFPNISIWTTWWYWVKIFKIKQSRETR